MVTCKIPNKTDKRILNENVFKILSKFNEIDLINTNLLDYRKIYLKNPLIKIGFFEIDNNKLYFSLYDTNFTKTVLKMFLCDVSSLFLNQASTLEDITKIFNQYIQTW